MKHVIASCIICKRHNGPLFCLSNMPPWPWERVSRSTPFQYVGLDYLRPIRVKEGGCLGKSGYACLRVKQFELSTLS